MAPHEGDLAADATELRGIIRIITYHNPDSTYTVLRLVPDANPREQVTAVGRLMSPVEGEHLHLHGTWKNDARYGRQFAFEEVERGIPETLLGLERFLGSGLFPGLGEKRAHQIVERFGNDVIRMLDETPERLTEIHGLGRKAIKNIAEAWQKHRGLQETMSFLQGHGITPGLARRIVEFYGPRARIIVSENPYRMARDIPMVGFRKSDAIARKMGFPADSPERAEAAVLFLLDEAGNDGHCFLTFQQLIDEGVRLLTTGDATVEPTVVEQAVVRLHDDPGEYIVAENVERPDGTPAEAVYASRLARAEIYAADKLHHLASHQKLLPRMDVMREITAFEDEFRFELAAQQRAALVMALAGGLCVLTGGPGTGKTTIVRALLHILGKHGVKPMLAAPTGRAAKRLEESTGSPARTIHRMLAWDPATGRFAFNAKNTLKTDFLVVDEVSMLDIQLAGNVLRALAPTTSLLFVGDADQLPSVGPGDFLRDLLASQVVPVTRLTEVFRQASRSLIIQNAHRINAGLFPSIQHTGAVPTAVATTSDAEPTDGTEPATAAPTTEDSTPGDAPDTDTDTEADAPIRDFFFISREQPEDVLETLRVVIRQRIPRSFRLDPVQDVQVLAPMHRNSLGCEALNQFLQGELNSHNAPTELRPGVRLAQGDKVLQTRNNYDLDVYNGDVGRVAFIDRENRTVRVDYEGRMKTYAFEDLDQLQLAYAMSIHKSQGSEYPAVVVIMHPQHHVLLQRNLLYTAVTRARRLVVLIGSPRAVSRAVKNAEATVRNTALSWRLRRAFGNTADSTPPPDDLDAL